MLQGVGYPEPNLSHFPLDRDLGHRVEERRVPAGRLAHAQRSLPRRRPRAFAADGVIIGSQRPRPARRRRHARDRAREHRAVPAPGAARVPGGRRAQQRRCAHILKVEADIVQAAAHLDARRTRSATEFPQSGVRQRDHDRLPGDRQSGRRRRRARHAGGFDTHGNQPATQARLLGELGAAASSRCRPRSSRARPLERHAGADLRGVRPAAEGEPVERHRPRHGQRALRARRRACAGGLYGEPPPLDRLAGDGNLGYALDFRSVYATVLERWWGMPSAPALGGRFAPLPIPRA